MVLHQNWTRIAFRNEQRVIELCKHVNHANAKKTYVTYEEVTKISTKHVCKTFRGFFMTIM